MEYIKREIISQVKIREGSNSYFRYFEEETRKEGGFFGIGKKKVHYSAGWSHRKYDARFNEETMHEMFSKKVAGDHIIWLERAYLIIYDTKFNERTRTSFKHFDDAVAEAKIILGDDFDKYVKLEN